MKKYEGLFILNTAGKEDTVNGAHYYRTKDSGKLDAIGIQISSAGPDIDAQLTKFKADGDSESALYLQGLSDRLAEDMASYMHNALRERLAVNPKFGTRWSPGYPGMVNMVNNEKLAYCRHRRSVGKLVPGWAFS